MADTEYSRALKLGEKEYRACVANGEFPYIPALDDILRSTQVQTETDLGLVDIPLELIVGTKTVGRQNAFARNFMPIMNENTEFAMKWSHLYDYQMEQGVSDPIIAYEYMNRFYVLEGNKRVSVLKYLNAFSIEGTVTRIVPVMTEDPQERIFYEYMEFYRKTQINYVVFSKEGSFAALIRACGKGKDDIWTDDERTTFSSAYLRFSRLFAEKKGQKLGITAGDGFLLYLAVYPYAEISDKTDAQLKGELDTLWPEMSALQEAPEKALVLNPEEDEQGSLFQRFFRATGSKHLQVAFVHEKSIRESSWTYGHELGRNYLQQTFGDRIVTTPYFMDAEGKSREEIIEEAIADGNHIVFAAAQRFLDASLKAAIRHPDVKILCCGVNRNFHSVRTYYGRMYEAKFLEGMIAGAMTRNDRIAYSASYPIYGSTANINAFALGVGMTNPRARIYLHWASRKNADFQKFLEENDLNIVSDVDMIRPGTQVRQYGLYMRGKHGCVNLAAPLWNWGKFYEKIIRDILSGSFNSGAARERKTLSYWWGISSSIIDLIVSREVPYGVRTLTDVFRREIFNENFHPFYGELTKQDGTKIGEKDSVLSPLQIISMDWLLDSVIGDIPKPEELTDEARSLAAVQGIGDLRDTEP